MNGEEDRHDPKFQLHQFEEDQEWEDESLLVLDPSPSSCQFVRKFIKNKGSKRIGIRELKFSISFFFFTYSCSFAEITVGYASALHPSELVLVHDHGHCPETSRGSRVVDRVNESSFRNKILGRVPDEVQGLHYAGLERTRLGQFRDNRLLRQWRDSDDADRAVLEFLTRFESSIDYYHHWEEISRYEN